MNETDPSGRLISWVFRFSMFRFEVRYKKIILN